MLPPQHRKWTAQYVRLNLQVWMMLNSFYLHQAESSVSGFLTPEQYEATSQTARAPYGDDSVQPCDHHTYSERAAAHIQHREPGIFNGEPSQIRILSQCLCPTSASCSHHVYFSRHLSAGLGLIHDFKRYGGPSLLLRHPSPVYVILNIFLQLF